MTDGWTDYRPAPFCPCGEYRVLRAGDLCPTCKALEEEDKRP